MTIAATIVYPALLCSALLFCICKSQQINEKSLIYEAEFKLRKSLCACVLSVCVCLCVCLVCVLCVLFALLTLCCFGFFCR